MMQCQTPGCNGLSGAICTGAGQWIQFCPICKTKQAIQPPRQPDEADGVAVRALVDLQRANYAAAEKGFLDAAAKTAQDASRQAFYLWCSLIARYGVEYVQEVQFESIPARRSCLFVPTFGRFPLPDHRIMETEACQQLDMLLFGMPGVDVGSHLRELDILIQEIEDCCRDRKNQYNVFIAWHDRADDGHGPCRTFADRLNSYLNAQRDCYSFVSFRSLHDVIVDHYEPHIYTALASARVMVIVVDDLDAMQRKFLRSEINRFLIRRAANHKLHIYLCCMQGATGTPPAMMAGWQRRNGCENTDVWYELVTKDVMERLRDDTPAPKPEPVPQPEPPKPEPVPQPVPIPEPEPAPEAEQKKQKKIDWKNVLSTAYKVLKPIISNFFVKTNDVTGKKGPTKRGLLSSITAILLCISQVVSGVVMPDGAESGQGFSALIGWVKQGWVSVFGEKREGEEGDKGDVSSDKTAIPSPISYSLSNDSKEIVVTIPKHTDSSIKSYSLYRTVGNTTARELLHTFKNSSNLTYTDKDLSPGKSYTYFYVIQCKDGSKYKQSYGVTVTVPKAVTGSKQTALPPTIVDPVTPTASQTVEPISTLTKKPTATPKPTDTPTKKSSTTPKPIATSTTESTAPFIWSLAISAEDAELQRQRNDQLISRFHGLQGNGTVITAREELRDQVTLWRRIVSIKVTPFQIIGLRDDGSITVAQEFEYWDDDFRKWTNIKNIAVNSHNMVGVKKDGTVIFTAYNDNASMEPMQNWDGILEVAIGDKHYIGLKKDGTVVAAGSNSSKKINVGEWKEIVAIAAGSNHSVGLKSDGTVVATGYNASHQCDVNDWTNIISIAAGSTHTVGLRADGTVVAIGNNKYRQCEVSSWTDIIAIAANENQTIGMKSDGTIVIAYTWQ